MKLYDAQTSQAIDKDAIQNYSIAGLLLMKRAAWFAFNVLEQHLIKPNIQTSKTPKHISIICGTGNNGGDGFMLAQYAKINGYSVSVSLLGSPTSIKGDALTAFNEMQALGVLTTTFGQLDLNKTDIIVDAIFGTGLNKPITDIYAKAIEAINQANKPVLAIDVPSGINADNGALWGQAIRADHTCTFITQKLGLHTAQGQDYSGQIHFSKLHLDKKVYKNHSPIAHNHPLKYWLNKLPARLATHHKGSAGTSALIGGNTHMMGAIQLAGLASLKSGCGLIKIITQPEHAVGITQAVPELMCFTSSDSEDVLASAKAIGIGPGLGKDEWAQNLFNKALDVSTAKVIDADGLHLLKIQLKQQAQDKLVELIKPCEPNWVLTPHPGEAATLLGWQKQQAQDNRVDAIRALHRQYGGVIVLKGNGTLIYDGKNLEVCIAGNAGMAVGGMGDVLTGAISSFLAQGLSLWDAANLGVACHAHAGDILEQQQGQVSITPSEVAQTIGQLLAYSGKPLKAH